MLKNERIYMLLNKWIFTILLILSIAILTTINNYYFYAHVARENERGAERIKILINNTLQLCQENTIDSSVCNKTIVETIQDVSKYYYYTTGTTLKDFHNNILWKKTRNKHDKIAVLHIDITLPDLNTSTVAEFNIENKWSNTNVGLSVFRSMTFSITQLIDIYNNKGMEEAWNFFTTVAWYRSRPTIGFTVFSFILLLLYKQREDDRIKMEEKKDDEIKLIHEEKLKTEKELEITEQLAQDTTVEKNMIEKRLMIEKKLIEKKYTEVYHKLKQYDEIINPPINTLNFDDLISLDTSGIGNKFRKTIEKLFLPIFKYQFNYEAKNLSEAIYKLSEKNIVSKEAKNYADIIRVYGNIDSHYNDQDNITKDEVIALANYVIKIVEEIVEKKLLSINIEKANNQQNTSETTNSKLSTNEKKSTGQKKHFDKETKKWVIE